MIPEKRRIRETELGVLQAALDQAGVLPVDDALKASSDNLEVSARCECGCATVDFAAPCSDQRSTVLANGVGRTYRGGQVVVIVWGRADAITGLEIYDLGAGQDDLGLPIPASIRAWESRRS